MSNKDKLSLDDQALEQASGGAKPLPLQSGLADTLAGKAVLADTLATGLADTLADGRLAADLADTSAVRNPADDKRLI